MVGYLLAPAAAATLVVFVVNWTWADGPPVLTIGYPVVGLCTAVIITDLTLGSHSLLRNLLTLSFLVWVGRISYGVYLWHFPVFTVLERLGVHDWRLLVLAGTGLTLAVSAASYYLIERRFLNLKSVFSRSAEAPAVAAKKVEITHQDTCGPRPPTTSLA